METIEKLKGEEGVGGLNKIKSISNENVVK